jgi:hypothetical protein
VAIRGNFRGGQYSGRGDNPHYQTGTYMGTQGNKHFFTAEGTGGDSSDSVTFEDPSSNEMQWNTRFQKGKQYKYQSGNPNLPFE